MFVACGGAGADVDGGAGGGSTSSAGGGDGGGGATNGGGLGGGGLGGGGSTREVCDDNLDNDGDGFVDCADQDCFTQTRCTSSCVDLCTANATICDGAAVRTCGQDPATGCRVFSTAVACTNGLTCSGGACLASCSNQCTAGAKTCSNTGGLVECRQQSNGCTDWVGPTACASGQVCSGATCVPKGSCSNQCTAGATRCTAGGQQQTCLTLSTGCTEWSLATACPSSHTCAPTATACAPVAACTPGAKRCGTAAAAVEECSANGTWFATQSCSQSCAAGACTVSTQCSPSTVRCNGNNVEVCNASGSAWLYQQQCLVGCAGGLCTDPCEAGQRRCNGSNVETCSDGGVSWQSRPLPDAGSASCANGCYQGDCMEADLIVDGVTKVLEGDLSFKNSVVIRNGGQLKVGPSGQLSIKAKSISVQDSASQLNANGVGNDMQTTKVSVYSYCYSTYRCCNNVYSGTTTITCVNGVTNNCSAGAAGLCPAVTNPVSTDDLSASEGLSANSQGGGLVRLSAERIEVKGQITANGISNSGGGTVVLAADTVTGDGALQATGSPIAGTLKVLSGSTNTFAGSTTGTLVKSVMPPLDVVSGSHPRQDRWYNDGLGDVYLAWSKPFAAANGYYWAVSTDPRKVPTQAAGQGTFLQADAFKIDAAKLTADTTNYFHVVSVDSSFNVGTVKNTFKVNISATPPTISSASHPTPRTWYQNDAIYLSWENPQADENFTGYYTAFDHFADTVPAPVPANFTTNKQVLLSNTPNGIWVFHLVNRDTRNAITKTARHFVVYVGAAPAQDNISGSVFDASNMSAPLAGVNISVNRGLFSTGSTSSGTYTFNGGVYVGQWELTASKPGYVSQTKTVTLQAGMPLNENFTLTKAN